MSGSAKQIVALSGIVVVALLLAGFVTGAIGTALISGEDGEPPFVSQPAPHIPPQKLSVSKCEAEGPYVSRSSVRARRQGQVRHNGKGRVRDYQHPPFGLDCIPNSHSPVLLWYSSNGGGASRPAELHGGRSGSALQLCPECGRVRERPPVLAAHRHHFHVRDAQRLDRPPAHLSHAGL